MNELEVMQKMVQKYVYGTPFETDAVVVNIPASQGFPEYGKISLEDGFSFTYEMSSQDVIYGLGENVRGINKRGYIYPYGGQDIALRRSQFHRGVRAGDVWSFCRLSGSSDL